MLEVHDLVLARCKTLLTNLEFALEIKYTQTRQLLQELFDLGILYWLIHNLIKKFLCTCTKTKIATVKPVEVRGVGP